MKDLLISFGLDPLLAGIVWLILLAVVLATLFMLISGVLTWVERRIFGQMQYRYGPNRVGPQGFLQWLADGVKMILKEDLIPEKADRIMFRIAPYLCVMGIFGTFVVLPWGSELIPADLNVGILYFISITSMMVIGILMAGWSSNNKWSLLGGMRAAAQIVSYEIPVAMGLLPPILAAGTLSMGGLMANQGWLPWDWTVFQNPFTALSFFIFFTGSLAEANRTPFDLPEADSELISGYCTEYSGFRYGAFYLSEWANLFVLGSLTTAVFLGGGNLPESLSGVTVLSVFVFEVKTMIVIFLIIWIRWTLPRFRIDQVMKLSWKYLLPGALVAFFGQAIYMMIAWDKPIVLKVVSIIMFLIFLYIMWIFIRRVRLNVSEQSIPAHSRPKTA